MQLENTNQQGGSMTVAVESDPSFQAWDGDVMSRHDSAEFLYRLVMRKFEQPRSGAVSFALDGDWGTGKSFFVKHMSDALERWDHPVIRFDAWKNDLSEDPLIGFMAELNSSLEKYFKKMPKGQRTSTKKLFSNFVSNARKAVIPATLSIAKSVTKHYAGELVSDIRDAVAAAPTAPPSTSGNDFDNEAGKAALDEFFKNAMESHSSRQKAISELKESIIDLFIIHDNQSLSHALYPERVVWRYETWSSERWTMQRRSGCE
ncbi:MAG: hypothetical protein CFE43_20585, partial [Burkholderiales bacterium PBB3]